MSDAAQQPLMPPDAIDAVVAWHNVAGEDGVLNAMPKHLAQQVSDHYAPRAADHFPHVGGEVQCYLKTDDTGGGRAQAVYRGALANAALTPTADLSVLASAGVRKALLLPYIRLIDNALPAGVEWVRYGLPPEVTRPLKNKADLQTWMAESGFAAQMLNHVICSIDDIPGRGKMMLALIETMYDQLDMSGQYPLGLMIRGEFTDGNYGSAAVVEALKANTVGGRAVRCGQVIVKRDGKIDNIDVCDGWPAALESARQHVAASTDRNVADRVVITRLIDYRSSPGLCAAVAGGVLHTFPFNGQYIAPGETACTGTCSFRYAAGEAQSQELMGQYYHQGRALLAGILERFLAACDDRASIYAMLNIDLLIPGALEAELWGRANRDRAAFGYLGALANCNDAYIPRIYDPGRVLMTEINPRDTNWTIAIKSVMQVLGQPCTLENFAALAEGREMQILARDHWPLPQGVSLDRARERLLKLHARLAQDGEGFIMRMPDNPAGVILYTPNPARLEQIEAEAQQILSNEKV